MEYVFMTRSFWKEINVSEKRVRKLYKAYLGTKDLHISSREESIKYLSGITSKIQAEMTNEFKNNNPEKSIKDLYKILDEVYHFYYRQKEARSKIVEAGINSGEIIDVFSENRNMARNVIDSVNLWLENSLLFQDRLTDAYDKDVNLSRDNRFVVTLNIILRNDAGVLNSGLVKKIGGVSLLKKGITDVFLVAENLVDGACMPSWFSCAGKNTIRFKTCSNLIHAVAFKVLSVDSLYNFSLFRVDNKVSFFIFSVAKEAVVVNLYLTVLVAELKSKLNVLA